MDQHSIAGESSASSLEAEPRFPGEDGGESLARMARRDLDAALQLLAERAQYITGASGAAIALGRGAHAEMVCRASAGPNAPELGALLSMEHGLSGESVRTRQALRCDDSETDPRVNREGCRQLGIASVVVMPIMSEQRVLGVIELFSGKPHAFEERDLSALHRLGEMVETAVKHAEAARNLSAVLESADVVGQLSDVNESPAGVVISADLATASAERAAAERDSQAAEPEKLELEKGEAPATAKKPIFWSASVHAPRSAGPSAETVEPGISEPIISESIISESIVSESIPVPAALRNLQKCKACGFPVSQGRAFCVECEEKQWHSQRVP
jgi:GAF domain-containing protein